MAEPLIHIETKWLKEPGTCLPCTGCGDIIYGETNQFVLMVNDRVEKCDLVLCNSCYDLIKDNVQE